ncbi:hypothetical protein BPOR_0216g00170 [Botrytis porri]|uniref:Uncharacterized protein n=1 Tax=Botrytis porri TaxID=87229 RepID=A0A4Z1KNC6_9HELO|nr:hypothetical protein BPOR_0216g00170 [Botrytis porri]
MPFALTLYACDRIARRLGTKSLMSFGISLDDKCRAHFVGAIRREIDIIPAAFDRKHGLGLCRSSDPALEACAAIYTIARKFSHLLKILRFSTNDAFELGWILAIFLFVTSP